MCRWWWWYTLSLSLSLDSFTTSPWFRFRDDVCLFSSVHHCRTNTRAQYNRLSEGRTTCPVMAGTVGRNYITHFSPPSPSALLDRPGRSFFGRTRDNKQYNYCDIIIALAFLFFSPCINALKIPRNVKYLNNIYFTLRHCLLQYIYILTHVSSRHESCYCSILLFIFIIIIITIRFLFLLFYGRAL